MKFNIKKRLTDFKLMIQKLFEKYPITLILIYLITFCTAILMNTDLFEEDWIQKILMYASIWTSGVFFAENAFEKGIKRIGVYVLTGIVSAIFIHFLYADYFSEIPFRWLVCYISTLAAGSLFLLIKKSGKEFSEYVLKVAINIFKSGLIYGILALGIAIILWIFSALIWNAAAKYIGNIEILILGFFYSTKIIYCFIDLEEDVNKFFKNLIKYVYMPLIIATFVIIYLYIIKILVLRDIPKNQIFRIATALFIVGGFIWTVMNYFKEEGIMYKISTKLPLVFSPFILLQIYTLGIRISKNGITPLRYAGILFIIFEICYILCYIFKNKKIQYMIIIANVLLIIYVLVPKINAYDVSDNSQIKNLKIYNQKSELTEEDKRKISGAYYYLTGTENGKKYIEKNLTQEQRDSIKELNTTKYNRYRDTNLHYISLNNTDKINVEGYKYILNIEASNYNDENLEKAFSKVPFKSHYKVVENVNILDRMKEYINISNDKKELEDYFKEKNEIYIDQNKKIIIKTLNFTYDDLEKVVQNYSISAYLLEK